MKGILCSVNVETNEEYGKILKARNRWCVVAILFGVVAALTGYFLAEAGIESLSQKMLGFYSGIGTGIVLIGIIFLIKNKMLLKNEDKLKESRLAHTDERLLAAGNLAIQTALKFMILAIAIICLGAIFYPPVLYVLLIILLVFSISYYIAYSYYQKKM